MLSGPTTHITPKIINGYDALVSSRALHWVRQRSAWAIGDLLRKPPGFSFGNQSQGLDSERILGDLVRETSFAPITAQLLPR